jgi:hypothetical protein
LWDGLDHLRRVIPPPATIVPDSTHASRWDRGFAEWSAAVEALLAIYRSDNNDN